MRTGRQSFRAALKRMQRRMTPGQFWRCQPDHPFEKALWPGNHQDQTGQCFKRAIETLDEDRGQIGAVKEGRIPAHDRRTRFIKSRFTSGAYYISRKSMTYSRLGNFGWLGSGP